MAMIQFLRGTQAGLAGKETINGALYFTTDTHKIYMGTETGKQEFSAIEVVSAVSALPTVATAIKGKFYYAEAENVFCFPYNGEWKQVNPDTGATSIEIVDGGGNAISAASYDASTRKITLTKGVTFATPAVVDSKISDKVGDIEGTVKKYVDDKTSGIASNAALEELAGRVTTAESDIDALQTAIADGGDVNKAIKAAQAAADAAQAAANKAQTTADSKTTMAEVEAKNYATKTEAQGYADAKNEAIAAAKKAGDDAQADVDALEAKVGTIADGSTVSGLIGTAQAAADAAQADVNALSNKVGTVTEGKTVVQMIADAQAAATYDDTQIKANIKTNADAIGILNGTGAGSVSKQVADAVASIVADAPEAYNTLKEISDWISSHASDASAMNSQINTNKTNIADLTALVGTLPETATSSTVVDYIGEAIDALKIGDYAKATELAAAVARISTAEGKITTLESQVATINGDASTTGSIAKASADTLASAKAYADGLNTTMDTRVKAIENKGISDGANKVEKSDTNGNIKIDGVETVVYTHPAEHAISEVTGLQSALDAKATVTALNATNANVTANAEAIDNLDSGKADKATTLKGYGITDAYTKAETYTQAQVDALLAWGEF